MTPKLRQFKSKLEFDLRYRILSKIKGVLHPTVFKIDLQKSINFDLQSWEIFGKIKKGHFWHLFANSASALRGILDLTNRGHFLFGQGSRWAYFENPTKKGRHFFWGGTHFIFFCIFEKEMTAIAVSIKKIWIF